MIDPFSRLFHGLRREIPLVPAMNRWAILSRPLTRTGKGLFLQSSRGLKGGNLKVVL